MKTGLLFLALAAMTFAQVTSVRLPTTDTNSSFQIQDSGNAVKLRANGDGGFYMGGTFGTGTIPVSGAGARMMWFPTKVAFRAGYVNGTQWDDGNIGIYSTAMGYGTTASGNNTTAMGYFTTASGNNSTAMGYITTASGIVSTAMGQSTRASGNYSTAMGYITLASGDYSTAMGYRDTASGIASTAMGYNTIASGPATTAIGRSSTASGQYSTAMGNYVSTNNMSGAFIIGDYSSTSVTTSTTVNQMTMRFTGGYRLFTNVGETAGAQLAAGASSWSAVSDSTKKTNFVKADHDYFLSSLSKLKLGSWNYKTQDAKRYRHYGPMAQEIFRYFGNDGKGTIGNDTMLATADMDGIMMICLQALEKRTSELQKANDKIAALQSSYNELKTEMQQIKQDILLLAQAKNASHTDVALNTRKGQ